jgi:hypothetical protein
MSIEYFDYLSAAIRKLRPNAEFAFSNRDYSTIEWFVLEGDAPTQAEINDAIEQVKADEIGEAEAKAQAKALAEAKLEALGLTTDDLKALGL